MEEKIKQCPEFPFFGASYPDAICCDGYLWDLDSYDSEVGGLTIGGDVPCPFCKTEEFIEYSRSPRSVRLPDVWLRKARSSVRTRSV